MSDPIRGPHHVEQHKAAPSHPQAPAAATGQAKTRVEGAKAEASKSAEKPADKAHVDAHHDEEAHRQALLTLNHSLSHFDTAGKGGKGDGIVSTDDLKAVAGGKGRPQEQQAARYLLEHSDHLKALDNGSSGKDGQGDGKISQKDIDAQLVDLDHHQLDALSGQDKAHEEGLRARQQSQAIDALKGNFDSYAQDGKISRESLSRVASQGSPEQKATARYFLDHPDRFQALDKAAAKDGKTDNVIARGDIDKAGVDAFNELRTHPDEQRQKEVDQQRALKWNSVDDIRKNLKDNPDLSTYSKEQLLAADVLAQKDPQLRDQLQKVTSDYVTQRTRGTDDIPEDGAFQKLLLDQVVDPKDVSDKSTSKEVVGKAQDQLKSMLRDKLEKDALGRLDGQSGDDAAKQAVQKFVDEDLKKAAERNPALSGYLSSQAQSVLEGSTLKDAVNSVQSKDDNFLTKGLNWVGDKLGGLLSEAVKISTDLGPIGLTKLTFDKLGFDSGAEFLSNIQGGLGNSAKGVVTGITDLGASLSEHPVETVKGLADLGLNFGPLAPFNDFKQMVIDHKSVGEVNDHKLQLAKGLWNSFTAGYKETAQQYGTEGAVAHVFGDVALAVASGGTSAEAEGGLKGASILSKVSDLRVVSTLRDFAATGRTAEALSTLKDVKDLLSASPFDNLSPGLQSAVQGQVSSVGKAAADPTTKPESETDPENLVR